MMRNGLPEKFMARKNHKDLFYIELCIDDEIDFIHFNSSLPLTIYEEEKTSKLISDITNFEVPDNRREELISELLAHLQTLSGIEKYYFSEFLLDKNGHYMEYYDVVTSSLLSDKDFEDYTVFTSTTNSFYFDFVKPLLEAELKNNAPDLLDKNTFEKLIQNSEELAREYVNLYQKNTRFFESIFSKETGYECYAMAVDFEVKLFFVRRRV